MAVSIKMVDTSKYPFSPTLVELPEVGTYACSSFAPVSGRVLFTRRGLVHDDNGQFQIAILLESMVTFECGLITRFLWYT